MEMAAELDNPISSGDFLPQWGVRKRMRCGTPQVKQAEAVIEKKSTIRVDRHVVRADKEAAAAAITISTQQAQRHQVKSVLDKEASVPFNNSFHSSPPRPQRSTRSQHPVNNIMCTRSSNNTDQTNTMQDNKALNLEPFVWPKVCLTLSLSLIEEDFITIKGSKLPLKPKKRLKSIQRAIHNVSPGGWLNDISQERYEVRLTRRILYASKALLTFGQLNTQKTLVSTIHPFHSTSLNEDVFSKPRNNSKKTSQFSQSPQKRWDLQKPLSSKPSQKTKNKQNNVHKDEVSLLICQAINQTEWSDKTETDLHALNIELSTDTVLSVLETHKKNPETALNFFKWVASKTDFSHNSTTYNVLVRVLGKQIQSSNDQLWKVIEEMVKEGFQMDLETYAKVLRRFLRNAMFKDAVALFGLMMGNSEDKPSTESCSTILFRLSQSGSVNIDLVYGVVETFRKGNGHFNKAVYDGIHRCLVNAGRFEEAEGVVKAMEKMGFVPDNITYSQLVFGLCKAGRLDEACNILDWMEGLGCMPDIKTWTILIEGYCKAGRVDRAVSSFELMLESGCKADAEVLAVLVDAFCGQDRVEDAHSFLCKMIEEKGLKPWQATFKELLQKLAREEKLPQALKLLKLMKNQGFPSFADPFFELFAKSGTVEGALQFLNMLRKKRAPSVKSYFSMLDAFCRAGKQAEALQLLHKCPNHIQGSPDVLSRFGLVETQSPA